ncbi:hypothetical protein [Nonomuraea gerenzanensis]|uniref:hypothetical protein n=1 Tax=Nonomuraea gerenzanensis TaxID=93944 RepID=UPI001CDA1120|nr:hypothetical protein [Nonomuraea gerenzanensis]UBU10361.1 hypothetical protein LCN96_39345 [Nonomuraea gerenzanensis]
MRTRTSVTAGVLLLALAGTIGVASAATGDLPTAGPLASAAGAGVAADDSDVADLIVAHGSPRLPYSRLADWAGYADHVVAATASQETGDTPDEEDIAAGEGYIGRSVRLTVNKTFWSRTSADGWTPAPPTSFPLNVVGWQFTGETRTELVVEGAPRVEAGHTYLIPIAHEADGTWAPIAAQAILPYDRGVIGRGEAKGVVPGEETPAQLALQSKDETALAATLASARPDPLVAQYASLDPDARWEKVAAELAALDPTPEEDTADHGEDEINVDPWNGAEDNVEENPEDVGD